MERFKKNINNAFTLAVIAALCGGSTPVSAKIALEVFPPFTLIAIRSLFAMLFLLPFIIKRKELSWPLVKQYAGVSIVGALNPILFFMALQYTQASVSPLIYASVPALTAVYLYITRGATLQTKQFVGIVLGFAGVVTIVALPLLEKDILLSAFQGNILIFVSAIVFMLYGVMSHAAQQKDAVSPVALTFYFILYAFIISLPFSIFEIGSGGIPETMGVHHVLHAVYIGVVGTGISYVAYQQAIKIGSAVAASLFTYLQPLVTISLAWALLGEQVSLFFILGGVLAIVGARLASR